MPEAAMQLPASTSSCYLWAKKVPISSWHSSHLSSWSSISSHWLHVRSSQETGSVSPHLRLIGNCLLAPSTGLSSHLLSNDLPFVLNNFLLCCPLPFSPQLLSVSILSALPSLLPRTQQRLTFRAGNFPLSLFSIYRKIMLNEAVNSDTMSCTTILT